MKVLVVVEGICLPGVSMTGIGTIYEIQKCLARKGVEVHILTSICQWSKIPEDRQKEWFDSQEKRHFIKFHYVHSSYKNIWINHLEIKSAFLRRIYQLDKTYKYDIVNEYSSSPLLLIETNLIKKLTHACAIHTWCTYLSGILGSAKTSRICYKRYVDKIICLTKHMFDEMIEAGWPEAKLTHIPIGIESAHFSGPSHGPSLRDQLNIPQDRSVVLFLGPLEERKGAFVLAQACVPVLASYPDVMFVFATFGSGGIDEGHEINKEKLYRLTTGSENSILVLEGHQNVHDLFKMADIFVLPQTSGHGTIANPVTLLEAMASGAACIASDIIGVNEVIDDGQNGLLFQNRNSLNLADRIVELLQSEDLRLSLGRRAREKIAAEYDIDKVVNRILKIYQSIYRC